jgi:hypothetical protein
VTRIPVRGILEWVFAGLVGGVVGAVVGVTVGGSCAELDCEPGAIYGLIIGGLATGAHLANGSRGNLGISVLARSPSAAPA